MNFFISKLKKREPRWKDRDGGQNQGEPINHLSNGLFFSNEINAARVSASPVILNKGNTIIEKKKIKLPIRGSDDRKKNAPLRTKETANQVHAATGR